jgi:hypothetical protein
VVTALWRLARLRRWWRDRHTEPDPTLAEAFREALTAADSIQVDPAGLERIRARTAARGDVPDAVIDQLGPGPT